MFDIGLSIKEWAKAENVKVYYEEELSSTNEISKEKISEFDSPFIVVTSKQTSGKGRGENTWTDSPDKGGLLASWVYKLKKPAQPIATPLFGLATFKAFDQDFDLNLSLKAPNDIYIDEKKLAGLLLEGLSQGDDHYLIAGLGLNVFTHPSVANSTALIDHIGSDLEKNRWLRTFSNLNALMSQASLACQDEKLSDIYIKDLEKALSLYPKNNITKVLPDGSIEVFNKDIISWRDL